MARKKPLKVVELFAGVGGFRLGLEAANSNPDLHSPFEVVWSNQWEPSTKIQHASLVYEKNFHTGTHTNEDIFEIVNSDEKFSNLSKLAPDLVVGGFPCQDYSVAKPLNKSKGLIGEKGVLWWAIYRLLERQITANPVKYLILENVDRLIKSPTNNRGRDFSVMLSSLMKLGYAVEWRIVNAADYGFPQRRRRIFIVAYHQSTKLYKKLSKVITTDGVNGWLSNDGVLPSGLPIESNPDLEFLESGEINLDPHIQTEIYKPKVNLKSLFENCGVAINGQYWTKAVKPAAISDFRDYVGTKKHKTLGDVVGKTKKIPDSYYIDSASLEKWRFFKNAKSIQRVKKNGITYTFDEGGMVFPDKLDRPARTIITGEGGPSPSRFKHVVEDKAGRLRRLVPEELEELNGFPRNFTAHPSVVDVKRAFFMGNALVVGVVTQIAKSLASKL
jgi:DNA (cytosine-5)-methyltransferase 1